MPTARREAWRPSARVGTLVCTARAGGVRVQIGPRRRPVQQQTPARGMASHLHATGSSPSQRHFLLEAILPRSCLNHPPPTLQPSWHHQDSQASGHRYLHLREGPGMA